jgi:transcriptional antiterminator NusG
MDAPTIIITATIMESTRNESHMNEQANEREIVSAKIPEDREFLPCSQQRTADSGEERPSSKGTAMKTMEQNWFALAVRSRHEFVVHDVLRKKGIVAFLPSVKRVRQWKDRKTSVEFPLFPGYLFVSIFPHPEEFMKVIKVPGSVTLLSLVPGYPTPVPSEEIDALKIVLDSGAAFDVYPQFNEGARVRIKKGPLCGAEGILANKEDQQVFMVNVELLGRSVGVKIQAQDVETA